MTRYFRRNAPGARENTGAALAALGVATGAALVTFYLVRIFLSREPLGPFDSPRLPGPEVLSLEEGAGSPSEESEG